MHTPGLASLFVAGAAVAAIAAAPLPAAQPSGLFAAAGTSSVQLMSSTHCGAFHGGGVAAQLHRCRVSVA